MLTGNNKSSLAVLACFILAFACLYAGISQVRVILLLEQEGKTADAVVDHVDIGARGSSWAVLKFVTAAGDTVESRDLFSMLLFRYHGGDRVTVLYRPSEPDFVTIDMGIWLWLQPAVLLTGFVVLIVLGILLMRTCSRQPDAE